MKSDLIKKLTDENFSEMTKSGLVLVDFYADWCGPCRMLSPVLEKVAEELKGQAVIGHIDIDHSQKTAGSFQIVSVPTLVLLKDGKEVNRLVGLRDAEAIKDFVLAAQ